MSAWAINAEVFDVKSTRISVSRGRLPRLAVKDDVIIFWRQGQEVQFVQAATVLEVNRRKEDSDETDANSFALTSQPGQLEPSRSLADFTYSLVRITRFDNPSRHFRRLISRLPDPDFRTLVDGEIYWSRSAFGFFINQLPPQTFIDFVQSVRDFNPQLLIAEPDFRQLWQLLRTFITDEYIESHYLASAIRSLSLDISKNGAEIKFEDLRIGSDDEKVSASLSQLQSNLSAFYSQVSTQNAQNELQKQRTDTSQLALFESLDSMISEREDSEVRFRQLFRKQSWPSTQPIRI